MLVLVAQLACVPTITERCRLVTNPTPPPALPQGFAELDALLVRRANDMTLAARDLNSSLVFVFHKDFAEVLLPELCGRLEKARELAMAGRTAEAGKKYQALLVSTQVLAYAVAMQSMAQYADLQKQPGFQLSQDMEKFASEAEPILIAALSEDPRAIERALTAQPEVFVGWTRLLEQWPVLIKDGAHKVAIAKVVWDIAFLVAATYQAAGAAAEIAAAGRPPMPPFPVLAAGGGATAVGVRGPAVLEMAEVLRKLLASGVLDAAVVAAISRTLGGSSGTPASPPGLPNSFQMSAGRENPPDASTPSSSSISPVRQVKPGEFSITDWRGYPEGLRKPTGPFRILQGQEYETARAAANRANAALRVAEPAKYAGKQNP